VSPWYTRHRAASTNALRDYFTEIAPEWDAWRHRNRFYHEHVKELVAGSVVPGRAVLEVGAGTGDVRAAVRPRPGVGLNVAERLTRLAEEKHPDLRFETFEPNDLTLPDGFRPDYVLSVNLLDHTHDIFELLARIRDVVTERTLLVLTTSNPLWAPVLWLGSRLGWRARESPRNFITNRDIASILHVLGFDVVEAGLTLPLPVRVPFIGGIINGTVPELPLLRYASSTQYIAARPRLRRERLSVSVIVPCHNEEKNVAACARRVPDMGAGTEIIFVDDGSTDGTRAAGLVALEEDARVRLIAFDTNHGKANAVRAGFAAAGNDVLMILDADMTVAPEDLPKFLAPLEAGAADFVNGTRLVYPVESRAMPIVNFAGNKALCLLVSWVVRQRVSDTLCGTKALLRRDYEAMPLPGRDRWGDFDLLFGAARQKLRILEVPIHYHERLAGESKMNVLRDGPQFLRACLAGWRMLRRPSSVPWSERTPAVEGVEELARASSA
jgi:ubiquinone/menaquinone biosynthesis C-methylase UbiE